MAFSFSSISLYHKALEQSTTTVQTAVAHYLQVIERQQHLNAMVAVFAEDAINRAIDLDADIKAGKPLLPLHGVIVAVKDVICIKDQPVSASSKMLNGHRALYDATAVARLKEAGAVIIGTCNCDEFAMGSSNETSCYGPVRNAINTQHVSGGSSGGSAVAVQAGMCMLSLGSDTGGSVRQPADFCGVWGLKPGYGAISRYGLIAYASSFDCIGIFGTNPGDIERAFIIMAGADERDGTCTAPKDFYRQQRPDNGTPARIAVFEPTLTLPGLDAEIKAQLTQQIAAIKQAGHTVDMLPFDLLEYIVPAYYVLTTAEASSNLSRYDGIRYGNREVSEPALKQELTAFYSANRSAGFGTEVKRRIMLGSFVLSSGYYDAYYSKGQQVRRLLVDQFTHIFDQYDAILMPVSPTTAFAIGEKMNDPVSMYLADIYTVLANLTGAAAMAVPRFTHSNGLPFGFQLLVKPGNELVLHRLAEQLAQC